MQIMSASPTLELLPSPPASKSMACFVKSMFRASASAGMVRIFSSLRSHSCLSSLVSSLAARHHTRSHAWRSCNTSYATGMNARTSSSAAGLRPHPCQKSHPGRDGRVLERGVHQPWPPVCDTRALVRNERAGTASGLHGTVCSSSGVERLEPRGMEDETRVRSPSLRSFALRIVILRQPPARVSNVRVVGTRTRARARAVCVCVCVCVCVTR